VYVTSTPDKVFTSVPMLSTTDYLTYLINILALWFGIAFANLASASLNVMKNLVICMSQFNIENNQKLTSRITKQFYAIWVVIFFWLSYECFTDYLKYDTFMEIRFPRIFA